jgi:hypothetical protein
MFPLTRRAAMVLAAFSLIATSLMATGGNADPADGKAEGTLMVNGKTVNVAYAYAQWVPSFADQNVKDIQVILSDVPLDAEALADDLVRIGLAKEGKLHAFEIIIDASGTPVSTAWRHDGFSGPMPSGLSSADVFTKKTFDDKIVEGSYRSAKEKEFFGNLYTFDVAFRATIAN